jgi:hypothetical protein
MKKEVFNFVSKLLDNKKYLTINCTNKAGRGNHYDFLINVEYEDKTYQEYYVEFKFNASSVDKTPQFVSPMKPSKYMNKSYEDYYYDNYLCELSHKYGLVMPSKPEYLKQIHKTNPKCMKTYQELYYNGCKKDRAFTDKEEHIQFYNLAKNLSKESINSFIKKADLNIVSLSDYLLDTQKNKIYMLYFNNSFILEKINTDHYIIDKVIKNPDKSRYECISKTGKQINVLLRWKNGNGIAFPAFQIS